VTAPVKTSAELLDALGSDDQIDPRKFVGLVESYVAAQVETGVREQTEQAVQAGLADFYRKNGVDNGRPDVRPAPSGPRAARHNPKALGAALDGEFADTGELFQMLAGVKTGRRSAQEHYSRLSNAYSTVVPSEGGILVPEEFRANMLRLSLESSLVRPRARVIPMATPRISFPIVEETSRASSLYGGVVAYWTEESAALIASSAKFGKVTLDAAKLTGYTEIPNELLADSSVSVSAFVDEVMPQALAWFSDDAFIRGNGVGQPLGFLNAACKVTQAAESGQGAGTIVRKNLIKMYSRMLPTSLGSAVWLANIDTLPALAELAATDNSLVWMGSPLGAGYTAGPPTTILGRPVLFTEKMESLGTEGDIAFVDLSYYLIGDRQQVTAMTSEHFRFNTDTIAYRVIERLDGRPWLQNAVTPRKGSNTLSPIVTLNSTRT
jgi:HK97 family phage major capsid protein